MNKNEAKIERTDFLNLSVIENNCIRHVKQQNGIYNEDNILLKYKVVRSKDTNFHFLINFDINKPAFIFATFARNSTINEMSNICLVKENEKIVLKSKDGKELFYITPKHYLYVEPFKELKGDSKTK